MTNKTNAFFAIGFELGTDGSMKLKSGTQEFITRYPNLLSVLDFLYKSGNESAVIYGNGYRALGLKLNNKDVSSKRFCGLLKNVFPIASRL